MTDDSTDADEAAVLNVNVGSDLESGIIGDGGVLFGTPA